MFNTKPVYSPERKRVGAILNPRYMKLEYTHEITERRKKGVVNQTMIIRVDYDSKEDSISDIEVFVTQAGVTLEISKLLDKAEGDPLCQMIEAIDWRQLAAEYKLEMQERRAEV